MKKITIFIAILFSTLSISLYSQNDLKITQNVFNNSSNPALLSTGKSNSQLNILEQNGYNRITHAVHRVTGYIGLFDSIYDWNWDTNSINWSNNQAYDKYVDFIYDSYNNNTSQTYKIWNGFTWKDSGLYLFGYNANNKDTNDIYKVWDGSAWVNSYWDSYTYDLNNNLTSWIDYRWNGSAWQNSFKYTFTFNVNNDNTSELYQTGNGSNWENVLLDISTYDVNNNMISDTTKSWNGSAWVNTQLISDTYDSHHNVLSDTGKSWIGGAWTNFGLDTYTYDVNNNMISHTSMQWQNSAWQNTQLRLYSYDANNNRTSDTTRYWNNSTWANAGLVTYTYNPANKLLTTLDRFPSGLNWINHTLSASTYDANNIQLSFIYQNFNAAGTKVIGGDSTYYYQHDVLQGVDNLNAQSGNIDVYPNPGNGKFTFESLVVSGKSSVEIYNVLGELVYSNSTLNIQHSTFNIDLSSQANGVYFYRATAENGELIGQGKLIIQK